MLGIGPNKIVRQNVELMTGRAMLDVIQDESIGGNAGFITRDGETIGCVAVNGYANPKNGEILAFGNPQDLPRSAARGAAQIALQVSVRRSTLERRVEAISKYSGALRPRALNNLAETQTVYNKGALKRAKQEAKEIIRKHGKQALKQFGYTG